MLSSLSRLLTYLNAALYGILGLFLYFFSETLAPFFAWNVTPFMAMTIGGWCLANAWLAFITARRWKWNLIYSTLIYLWLFGIGQCIVLFVLRDKLNLEHPIAWLYLAAILVNGITALIGVLEWLRARPQSALEGALLNPMHRFYAAMFAGLVGVLGIYALSVQIGAPGTNGGVFPQVMSLFTLRSFGVFYLSISLAALPFVLWEKSLNTVLHHAFASYALILFVSIAAFVNIRLFDFVNKPGGLIYFGAYVIVGIPLFFTLLKRGRGA
jgi:hypothetical protein